MYLTKLGLDSEDVFEVRNPAAHEMLSPSSSWEAQHENRAEPVTPFL